MRHQEASRLSADCAMCYWGFAHACGPNLNEPHKTPAELRAGQLAASQAAQLLEQSPEIYSTKEQVKGWEMRGIWSTGRGGGGKSSEGVTVTWTWMSFVGVLQPC